MAQPQLARIACAQCNAYYNTERELRDHMRMVHRVFASEQTGSQPEDTQPETLANQPREPLDKKA
jgi:hypothetical protein